MLEDIAPFFTPFLTSGAYNAHWNVRIWRDKQNSTLIYCRFLLFFPSLSGRQLCAWFLRTGRVCDGVKWWANCQRAGGVRFEMNLLQKINPGKNGSASDSPPRNATKPVLFPWQPYQWRFLAACLLCTNQKWQINNVDSITHPPRCLSFPPVAALVWISGAPVRQDKSTADQDSSRVHHQKEREKMVLRVGWKIKRERRFLEDTFWSFLRPKRLIMFLQFGARKTMELLVLLVRRQAHVMLVLSGPTTHVSQKSMGSGYVVYCKGKESGKSVQRRCTQGPQAEMVQLHKDSAARFHCGSLVVCMKMRALQSLWLC